MSSRARLSSRRGVRSEVEQPADSEVVERSSRRDRDRSKKVTRRAAQEKEEGEEEEDTKQEEKEKETKEDKPAPAVEEKDGEKEVVPAEEAEEEETQKEDRRSNRSARDRSGRERRSGRDAERKEAERKKEEKEKDSEDVADKEKGDEIKKEKTEPADEKEDDPMDEEPKTEKAAPSKGGNAEVVILPRTRGTEKKVSDEKEKERLEKEKAEYPDAEAKPMQIQDGKISNMEPEFEDLKEQLFREKLQSIKVDIKLMKEGNFDSFKDQLASLEASRDDKIQNGDAFRQAQIASINAIFDCEKKMAEDDFEVLKAELKAQILDTLTEKQRRLEEQKDRDVNWALDDERERIQTRNRRRRADPTAIAAEKNAKKKKQANEAGLVVLSVNLNQTLEEPDILEDLEAIKKQRNIRGAVRSTYSEQNALFEVRFDNGYLFYQSQVFEKGDHVFVEVGTTGRQKGQITSISSSEVNVRVVDGTKTRIYLSQMRHGRGFIFPGLPCYSSSDEETMDE